VEFANEPPPPPPISVTCVEMTPAGTSSAALLNHPEEQLEPEAVPVMVWV
jgi:hypothetical protein